MDKTNVLEPELGDLPDIDLDIDLESDISELEQNLSGSGGLDTLNDLDEDLQVSEQLSDLPDLNSGSDLDLPNPVEENIAAAASELSTNPLEDEEEDITLSDDELGNILGDDNLAVLNEIDTDESNSMDAVEEFTLTEEEKKSALLSGENDFPETPIATQEDEEPIELEKGELDGVLEDDFTIDNSLATGDLSDIDDNISDEEVDTVADSVLQEMTSDVTAAAATQQTKELSSDETSEVVEEAPKDSDSEIPLVYQHDSPDIEIIEDDNIADEKEEKLELAHDDNAGHETPLPEMDAPSLDEIVLEDPVSVQKEEAISSDEQEHTEDNSLTDLELPGSELESSLDDTPLESSLDISNSPGPDESLDSSSDDEPFLDEQILTSPLEAQSEVQELDNDKLPEEQSKSDEINLEDEEIIHIQEEAEELASDELSTETLLPVAEASSNDEELISVDNEELDLLEDLDDLELSEDPVEDSIEDAIEGSNEDSNFQDNLEQEELLEDDSEISIDDATMDTILITNDDIPEENIEDTELENDLKIDNELIDEDTTTLNLDDELTVEESIDNDLAVNDIGEIEQSISSPDVFADDLEDEGPIALSGDELENILADTDVSDVEEGEGATANTFDDLDFSEDKSAMVDEPLENSAELEVESDAELSDSIENENIESNISEENVDKDEFLESYEDEGPIALSESELTNIVGDLGVATDEANFSEEEQSESLENDNVYQQEVEESLPEQDLSDYTSYNESQSEAAQEERVEQLSSDSGVPKQDMRKMLSYLDGLFDMLPEAAIMAFSKSEYFSLYKQIMKDLDLD